MFEIKNRIEIEKVQIPYSFDILLADEEFELGIGFNEKADLFTVTLLRDGEIICNAEPVIYGVPLFQDVYQSGFPVLDIIPLDESGIEDTVTYDNFNETVFLVIDDGGEDG